MRFFPITLLMTASVVGMASAEDVDIYFVNESPSPIEISWVHPENGTLVPCYDQLMPGDRTALNSQKDHVFEVRELPGESGECKSEVNTCRATLVRVEKEGDYQITADFFNENERVQEDDNKAVDIYIVNDSVSPIKVSWVSEDGTPVPLPEPVMPGDKVAHHTGFGQIFHVQELPDETGKCKSPVTCRDTFIHVWKEGNHHITADFVFRTDLHFHDHSQGKKFDELQESECAAEYNTPTARVWTKSEQSESNFVVGGRNLANYGLGETDLAEQETEDQAPFELYEDFDIGDMITGNEGYWDLLLYYQQLQRPSLSFYEDKVARKRWLPSKGFEQPKLYALNYGDELTQSHEMEDQKAAILKLIPDEADFVAKPSHMSESKGNWIVGYDHESKSTLVSRKAMKISETVSGLAVQVAESLAGNLHQIAVWYEAWATRNVKPGFVVEERFSAVDDEGTPPIELKVFTFWGRVFAAQCNVVEEQSGYSIGFIRRDGTMAAKSEALPEWLDWPRVVDIAERLGAHKDHFRTDIFVGVPAGATKPGATFEERLAAVKYVVSEAAMFPTSLMWDRGEYLPVVGETHENDLTLEAARLWIAGYKMGNYRTVPNTEVPEVYLETGGLPADFEAA